MAGEPHDGESPSMPPKVEIPKLEASLVFWLILFVLGGGLLALYYADIGYFPEFTWQDALTYMALMTIIGGSLLVAYGFLLFVPGIIWSEYLVFDRQLREVLMMDARDLEPCVFSITKRILFPFALFMAFCHCLLYLLNKKGEPAGLVAMGAVASLLTVSSLLGRDFLEGLPHAAKRKESASSPPVGVIRDSPNLKLHRWLVGISHIPLLLLFLAKAPCCHLSSGWLSTNPCFLWDAALFPLVAFLLLLVDSPQGAPAHLDPIPDQVSLLCRAILGFVSAALLGLAALWFFYWIYSGGEASGTSGAEYEVIPWRLLVLCTLVVILANLVVSVLYHKHPRRALLAGFLGALVLLGTGQLLPPNKPRLPARIMEKFGFGVPNVTLVLTEKGGRILCQHGISVKLQKWAQPQGGTAGSSQAEDFCAWQEPPGDSGKKAEKPREEVLARAEGLKILSRLGSQYLLGFENKKEKRTITLLKSEIVSWSVSNPRAQ